MSGDLVPASRVDSWVQMLGPIGELAKILAPTEFVPAPLRGKPAPVAAAILTGLELGIGPMRALTAIDVIRGTPTLRAELMRALVYRAGHHIEIREHTTEKCTLAGYRAGIPEPVAVVTYTLADARRAGLADREHYRARPRAMLAARATSELCRLVFPDVIGGLPDAGEVEEGPTSGATITPIRRAPTPPRAAMPRELAPPEPTTRDGSGAEAAEEELDTPGEAAPSIPTEAPPEAPPEPVHAYLSADPDPEPLPITARQIGALGAGYRRLGLTEREARLAHATEVLGRPLTTTKELTRDEASRLIAVLARTEPAEPPEEPPSER